VAFPGEAGILDASWTAPTTNIDGSPLTDLASYRVYYGTSIAPCPGGTFFEVKSSTPSPPANQTVTFGLTGLSTGTLYTVSVTAVDMSGNESPCSFPASAVARSSFAVSPTGSVNFGNVSVGSFADQVFTVSNTGGGTVAGTVTAPAPFRIVSGSPFNLVGSGATQAVTVRFTPTAPATATANVSFAADGDTISRIVNGIGIALDQIPPTVAITSQIPGSTYSTSLTLRGTASDNVGVRQVTWTNSRGGSGTASGTTSWTANGIALQLGTNVLTVTAQDAAGNVATASVTIARTALTFTDDPLAAGSTLIKAVHVMELRAVIDSLRAARGLATFAWTDPVLAPGSTPVKVDHLAELRTALSQAYQAAGRTPPTYTDPAAVAGVSVIRAVHLSEIRAAIRALP
jgi:Big-like domain-containing protein